MSHIFSNTSQIIVAKNGSYNLDVFKKIWQTKKNLEQWQRYVLQSCFAVTLVLLTKDTSYHVCIESFKKKKDDRRRLWKYMKLYGKYGRGFLDWFSWPLLCWQYRPPSAWADLSCNWPIEASSYPSLKCIMITAFSPLSLIWTQFHLPLPSFLCYIYHLVFHLHHSLLPSPLCPPLSFALFQGSQARLHLFNSASQQHYLVGRELEPVLSVWLRDQEECVYVCKRVCINVWGVGEAWSKRGPMKKGVKHIGAFQRGVEERTS